MKRLLLAVRHAVMGKPPLPRPGAWLMDGVSGLAARLPAERRLNPYVVDDGGAITGVALPTVGRMLHDAGRVEPAGLVTRRPDLGVVCMPLPTPLPGPGQRRHG